MGILEQVTQYPTLMIPASPARQILEGEYSSSLSLIWNSMFE